jgi:PKD repeat protein
VSLTVSDGHISDTETKENYITAVAPSEVEIGNITGGMLKISAEILNKGDINVTSVNWSITVTGFVLLGKTNSGTIPSIPIGGSEVVSDRPIIGLGNIIITVKVDVPGSGQLTKTVRGLLLLFVVLGIK